MIFIVPTWIWIQVILDLSQNPPGVGYRSFWIQVKRITSSYDIHSPHQDLDTGHFGSKSKELRHHMIFIVPTWIWIQVILDLSLETLQKIS